MLGFAALQMIRTPAKENYWPERAKTSAKVGLHLFSTRLSRLRAHDSQRSANVDMSEMRVR